MLDLGVTELCRLLAIKPHTLRYWEQTIPLIAPRYDDSGRKRYSEAQVRLLMRIKHLIVRRGVAATAVAEQLIAAASGPRAAHSARIEALRAILLGALHSLQTGVRIPKVVAAPPRRALPETPRLPLPTAPPSGRSKALYLDLSSFVLEPLPQQRNDGGNAQTCPLLVSLADGRRLIEYCLRHAAGAMAAADVWLAVDSADMIAVQETLRALPSLPQPALVGLEERAPVVSAMGRNAARRAPGMALALLEQLPQRLEGSGADVVVVYQGFRPDAAPSHVALQQAARRWGSAAFVYSGMRGYFWRGTLAVRVDRLRAYLGAVRARAVVTDIDGREREREIRWSDWTTVVGAMVVARHPSVSPWHEAERWPREVETLWRVRSSS